jgi:hypothetical protein
MLDGLGRRPESFRLGKTALCKLFRHSSAITEACWARLRSPSNVCPILSPRTTTRWRRTYALDEKTDYRS